MAPEADIDLGALEVGFLHTLLLPVGSVVAVVTEKGEERRQPSSKSAYALEPLMKNHSDQKLPLRETTLIRAQPDETTLQRDQPDERSA